MYRFEEQRQQHIEVYGSFLYCPERDNLCCYMEEKWKTGCSCSRTPCLMEDPEYQKLQARIRANVKRRERQKPEKEETVRRSRRQTKSWKDIQLEKIERLEEESRQAYKRNRPRVGENKLYEAMILRRELRRKESNDV